MNLIAIQSVFELQNMHSKKMLSILLNSLVICVLVLILYKHTARADDEFKLVETKFGGIRGVRKTSLLKNIPFYSFKGIPYAKSPTGDLRFKVMTFDAP